MGTAGQSAQDQAAAQEPSGVGFAGRLGYPAGDIQCCVGRQQSDQDGKKNFSVELNSGATVANLLRHLGIPPAENKIIIVNGRHGNEDTALNDGDEVAFMTPVEGG